MNFIDIASWQAGLNLSTLFTNNNLDGVMVKSTEGTGYTNPYYADWARWLHENKKPFGVYHYCDGLSAEAEAKHFYNSFRPYLHVAVPCADYEYPATNVGTKWLKSFLDAFYNLSGVRCLVYCSLSVVQGQNFNDIANAGYQLWLAQYADMNPVYGFQENPWQRGSVSPFSRYVMHQYTSQGYLNGWKANLDLSKFYGTVSDWNKLADADGPEPKPLKDADPEIVAAVLRGEYGINQERINKLIAAGYNPDSVQQKINALYNAAQNCKKYCATNMDYIDSIVNIMRAV